MVSRLLRIERAMVEALSRLRFAPPVEYVYNPLEYAREPHERYVRRWARRGCEAILLGMNPGPFGMAQTGVPFGEIELVRDWIGVQGRVERPPREHPKRPVLGFDCARREVSGARLWGWARDTWGEPEGFFERFFVLNYCPLVFVEESGRNRTPDKCSREERDALFEVCDRALVDTVACLEPEWVIGIGKFAEDRARAALGDDGPRIGRVLHPSPQSPAANRGWAEAARRDFESLGIDLPAERCLPPEP